MQNPFAKSVHQGRREAVNAFLNEQNMTEKAWLSITWDQWHTLPAFADLGLVPLGGQLRFPATDRERLIFSFRNTREGTLLGVKMEVNRHSRWMGFSEHTDPIERMNAAAREAIITMLELAYLRSKQC